MKRSDHEDLFKKYQSGKATPEEQAIVEDYILNHKFNPLYLSETELEKIMVSLGDRIRKVPFSERATAEAEPEVPAVPPMYRRWKSIVAVAAAVAAVTLGTWIYYTSSISGSSSRGIDGSLAYATDIAPGRNTATLTLADGKTINLSDAKSGVIINRSGVKYNDQSEIASSLRFPRNDGEAVMLTASTPRGGTYRVVLPDGTHVWLNADSKISFPSAFTGKERRIILSGEAYLEVAKDKTHPFVVQTDKQEVEVLGTHFNINAYPDEGATKTTLLEGSVRVSYVARLSSAASLETEGTSSAKLAKGPALGHATSRDPSILRGDGKMAESKILKPNQQAISRGTAISVRMVNAEEIIAWKNGDFLFEDEPLSSIMRKIERWYDVEVVYDHSVDKNKLYWGGVSRYDKVSKVLEKLALTGNIHFKIEGRKIIVMK